MASTIYCDVTSCAYITGVTITSNHDSPTTTATIECTQTALTLGDAVTIDLGYTTNHEDIFTGYVKQIERKIPDNTYVIVAYDNLVRAQDYFIASSNPSTPLKYKSIAAETLVQNLMAEAGLTSYDFTPTYFTFGVKNEFEVNLVSVYDYCRTIADLLTWTIWADADGTINFKNRKPYVMDGTTGQPGDVADTPTGYTFGDANTIDMAYVKSERSLRNRVVVYGAEGVYAEASDSSSLLPAGFYKTAVLAFPQLIDQGGMAQSIADYNLDLLNRVTETVALSVVGNPALRARTVITAAMSRFSITGDWYVFGCDHIMGPQGYITSMDLRRMTKEE